MAGTLAVAYLEAGTIHTHRMRISYKVDPKGQDIDINWGLTAPFGYGYGAQPYGGSPYGSATPPAFFGFRIEIMMATPLALYEIVRVVNTRAQQFTYTEEDNCHDAAVYGLDFQPVVKFVVYPVTSKGKGASATVTTSSGTGSGEPKTCSRKTFQRAVTIEACEDVKALIIKAYSGQTADIAEVQNSGGTALVYVDYTGKVVTAAFQLTTSPSSGYIMTSDASGNGTWQAAGAPAAHTHSLADITDEGALAALNTVGTAQIDNDAVTYAKMQNVSATSRVLGRSSAGAGDVEEIPFTPAGQALVDDPDASTQRTTLGLGALAVKNTVAPADIDDKAATLAKLDDIASDRLIGRDTAGVGVPEAIRVVGGLEFSGAGAIQRSALTGDVTAAAGSDATTIANDAVTYAKMQNISDTDKVLGRSTAGAGDVEEIACTAAGRALIDDADAAAQLVTLGAMSHSQVMSRRSFGDVF